MPRSNGAPEPLSQIGVLAAGIQLQNIMTQLLEKAFKQAARLPDEGQDEFARLMLAELASEQRWADLFARPESEDLLEQLADEALAEHRAGKTQRLNPDDL